MWIRPDDVEKSVHTVEYLKSRSKLTGLLLIICIALLFVFHYFVRTPFWIQVVLGVGALICGIILVYNFVEYRGNKHAKKRRLAQSTIDEKSVLRRFVENDSLTCQFLAYERGVDSLTAAGIIRIRYVTPCIAPR